MGHDVIGAEGRVLDKERSVSCKAARSFPLFSEETKRMNDTVYKITTYFGNFSAVALLVLAAALYLLPTIVGIIRKKRSLLNIAFFNVFLGWTVIAWAVMLIEAFKSDDAP